MTDVEPRVVVRGEVIAANVLHFTRLLRRAGVRVGPGDALDAQAAVAAIDVTRREQFYWALHAVLVRRHADHPLFDEAFRLFWRDPMGANSALSLLLPQVRTPVAKNLSRRLSEAWRPPQPGVRPACSPRSGRAARDSAWVRCRRPEFRQEFPMMDHRGRQRDFAAAIEFVREESGM